MSKICLQHVCILKLHKNVTADNVTLIFFFIVLCYGFTLFLLKVGFPHGFYCLYQFSDGLCTRRSSLRSGTSSRHANVPLT